MIALETDGAVFQLSEKDCGVSQYHLVYLKVYLPSTSW